MWRIRKYEHLDAIVRGNMSAVEARTTRHHEHFGWQQSVPRPGNARRLSVWRLSTGNVKG